MKYPFLLFLLLLSQASLAQENQSLWTVAWSHDDAYLAVGGSQGDLKLFDGKTFELIKTYPVEDVILSRLKWHPSQHKLAVITQSTTYKARILDVDKNTWTELEGLENSFRGLDWNHKGDLLAVTELEGEISIFDSQGKRVSRFLADPKAVADLDWHPKENILVAVGSRIGIYTQLGESLHIFPAREEEVFLLCVEWHPSGDFFATGDYGDLKDAKNKLIQYWQIAGEKLLEIRGSKGEYRNIRWSPDGNRLASACDALRIWDTKGKLVLQTESSEDYLWGIDWNNDGSKIVTSSSQGVISVFDQEGKLIRTLEY